ncbi:amidohydrolase family protein [Nocardioides sp. L-11A]|uniref:amidohydrolase family protein n=1 Tax=Nocardioides sp. L-11A TaxID=3043848 RepID=UPI00249AED5B|nr:amidohydrolase family protein [Nocardioides sp. L-11A]
MRVLLSRARLAGGRPTDSLADVLVEDGRVVATEAAGTLDGVDGVDGVDHIDLDGRLLLGAFAEPHAHLDKAGTVDDVANPAGDLSGAVAAWRAHRSTLSVEDIARRARSAALDALRRGTTAIRTHVDVGPGVELRGVDALVAVRAELRDLVDVQIVVMSYPLSGDPDAAAAARRRLEEALERGADLVGGTPHGEPDPAAAMSVALDVADRFGRGVDLHMDEHLRPSLDVVELARLKRAGFAHPVAASHLSSLAMRTEAEQHDVARVLAEAGVDVIACPATNLYLQARDRPSAPPRGLTAVRALLAGGVRVAGGGDNVQDPFNPLGSGDPLDSAQLLVLAGHVPPDQAVTMVGDGARAVLGLPAAGVTVGALADLVAVRAGSVREVVAERSADRIVLRRGRVVARTTQTAEVAW